MGAGSAGDGQGVSMTWIIEAISGVILASIIPLYVVDVMWNNKTLLRWFVGLWGI